MRILPEQNGVNPDTPDEYGRTPLSFSAQNGHEGVVRILLERNDVNPNTVGILFHQTPLARGAQDRREGVLKILLERNDVNLGTADEDGRTQLLLATHNGHERIVKLLSERADLIPGYAACPQRTEPLSPGQSDCSEPPFKRARTS